MIITCHELMDSNFINAYHRQLLKDPVFHQALKLNDAWIHGSHNIKKAIKENCNIETGYFKLSFENIDNFRQKVIIEYYEKRNKKPWQKKK